MIHYTQDQALLAGCAVKVLQTYNYPEDKAERLETSMVKLLRFSNDFKESR